jgi:hypothetical protein
MLHPNILKIYNLLDNDQGVFIFMEFLEGESFEDLLNRVGRLTPLAAVELMIPVLSGMEYSHQQGVIHRDIKPANLMLLYDGGVRVLDFGIAKLADRPGLTRVGMTLGTATYMSPEQHMGKELTEAADIYSLGATLFEMCTGRLPFEAQDTKSLIRQVLVDPPPSPRVYLPDIPGSLEAMILKCLAKKPVERYQTAAELEEALIAAREALRQAVSPAGNEIAGSEPAGGTKSAWSSAEATHLPLGGHGPLVAGFSAGFFAMALGLAIALAALGQHKLGLYLTGAIGLAWAAVTAALGFGLGSTQRSLREAFAALERAVTNPVAVTPTAALPTVAGDASTRPQGTLAETAALEAPALPIGGSQSFNSTAAYSPGGDGSHASASRRPAEAWRSRSFDAVDATQALKSFPSGSESGSHSPSRPS